MATAARAQRPVLSGLTGSEEAEPRQVANTSATSSRRGRARERAHGSAPLAVTGAAALSAALVLSVDEVAALTGRLRHAAQCRMLERMGIPHIRRPGLPPAVLRIHLQTLTARVATALPEPQVLP